MKELNTFRQFLNENLDEISLRGLMGRDMTGAEIAADPKKFEVLLGKIMSHIGDPSLEDKVRAWLKVELEEFADTDFSDPEEVKMTAKSAAYAMGLNDDDDLPSLNEVEPQTDLIGIAAHTLKDMSAEEAIDAIDRLMLYLKDAKADIEYKNK